MDTTVTHIVAGGFPGAPFAERQERFALPGLDLAGVVVEPARADLAGKGGEGTPCLDRGELAVVARKDDLCPATTRVVKEPGEPPGVDHARLVDDDDASPVEPARSGEPVGQRELVEEAVDCDRGDLRARFELTGGLSRKGSACDFVALRPPRGSRRLQGKRLA